MIQRNLYIEQLERSMWNGDVKVITGIRRCGKSVLLFDLFRDHLLGQGVNPSNIISIALDQRRFFKFRNPITLCNHVEGLLSQAPTERFYLFIDEVQFTIAVQDEESGGIEVTLFDMLNELKSYPNLDVYVTGSNSRMLSKDIVTEFRVRATQIHVRPFSFGEYYSAFGGDERAALDQYMLYGGMPRLLQIDDERDKKAYLSNLYEEVYVRDIVERNSLEREDVLRAILDYIASQIGSLTNPTKIANALSTMRGEKVGNALVSTYLDCVSDAFLVESARRYDVKGKAYFSYPMKYYYCDPGLRNARLNYRQYDPGHIMENIIYNELVSRGLSVDVGVVAERKGNERIQREIDFVVNDGDRRAYIQSAFRMDTEEKQDVELRSMMLTGDFFRRIVVRMDIPHQFFDERGVLHVNLIDFLLGRVDLF